MKKELLIYASLLFLLPFPASGQKNDDNPMGKTWVLFIENSDYETFANLEGLLSDLSEIRNALSDYRIDSTITLKNMTKAAMEKYFDTELSELVIKNNVRSIMIWYAGHGKTINDAAYWIPVDARRDNEKSYYNINQLRTVLKGYTTLVHTLIISDACESGPDFYTTTRDFKEAPDCSDPLAAEARSAQQLSASGYQQSGIRSKFTSTFATSLANNGQSCIPIETIARQVSLALQSQTREKPKFGRIRELADEEGTFFFIKK